MLSAIAVCSAAQHCPASALNSTSAEGMISAFNMCTSLLPSVCGNMPVRAHCLTALASNICYTLAKGIITELQLEPGLLCDLCQKHIDLGVSGALLTSLSHRDQTSATHEMVANQAGSTHVSRVKAGKSVQSWTLYALKHSKDLC